MSQVKNVRNCIFLSHATPEDNEFTRWLAGKLTLAGYSVWYDLDRLKGGDYFWNKIEDAIRNHSIRMIAIVSEVSHNKDGVRNEWDLSVTVEKQIPGFLIPVRIDDFDFSKLPITIHRKNVIDFYRGWHFGLDQLLDTLADSNIDKSESSDPQIAKLWLSPITEHAIDWVDNEETLESNWLPIISLPLALETARILSDARRIPMTDSTRKLPWFEFEDQIVGFAPRKDLVELFKDFVALEVDSAVETSNFIKNGVTWGTNKVSTFDARNRIATLVRQAWDLKMEEFGLKRYELSNQRLSWYVPSGFLPKDKVEFLDANGKRRKKQLTGTSSKYKVNWHYAISIHPVLNDIQRIELTAHIVFTDLDGQLVASTTRMHLLRRRFCKSWWNDRWRGFLRAFLALISERTNSISLPVGGQRTIEISALPMNFQSPRGLSDLADLTEEDEIQLEENIDDSLDDFSTENEDELE
ncbi:toll/interleukin-1 receptor domain-containing protein [Methylobacter sp.]|uniref:toll/interleukin-1 receptor domain-containing protein n=1 Tax=Methylobacter sp. TaxID=2051955 RepID=UPI0012068EF5|nr:toll/interleukin-1 receptor domain-containing protein [Methylobacter sp.]TAK63363.1 MAG: toll/interleukin-1 receptor domain-containing protein [Methylobacter sp.]